jgi:DNA invertase Pin-like site-specific DNA recombinase
MALEDLRPEGWDNYRLMVVTELNRLARAVNDLNATVNDFKAAVLTSQLSAEKRATETDGKVSLMWKAIGCILMLLLGALFTKLLGK